MTDETEYTFKIDHLTPETMSFKRLVEYYDQLATMLGNADHLHLVSINTGSHATALQFDEEHVDRFNERMELLKKGTAPKKAMTAHGKIVKMLEEDETSGGIFDTDGNNVVPFPSKRSEAKISYKVRDFTSFSGKLYYVAESKESVNIRLKTKNHGNIFGTTTLDIGRKLKEFLLEDRYVNISGRGLWTRDHDGNWTVSDFAITDFRPLKSGNLRDAIKEIQSLDIDWPDDPLASLKEIKDGNGGSC